MLGDKPKLNIYDPVDREFLIEILGEIIHTRGIKRIWEMTIARYKIGYKEEYFSALGELAKMGLAEKHWSNKEMDNYWTVTKAGKDAYRRR